MMPRVTAILAALNEAPNIGPVVRGCLAHAEEVLVIDDGSSDETAAVAAAAGARVVQLSKNRGKGVAVRRGAHEARGEVLVFLDADGQDDPSDIPALLTALHDDVDMVVGSRFLGHFEQNAIEPLHAWGNRALTGMVNGLFSAALTDTQAGFRALRRDRFLSCALDARGYDVEVDLVLELLGTGGRIVEVPVTRRARAHGHSHLRTFRDGTRIAIRIARQRLKRRRSGRGRSSPSR
ncbi:MAG: glycosyltransferase family 2 protein [Nannocystaceae bacterium]|nr:glycosyltransferase family 2 protein [Nannocystaceae bacterium]